MWTENFKKDEMMFLFQQDFERYLPELKIAQGDVLAQAKPYLNLCLQTIEKLMRQNCDPQNLVNLKSLMTDKLIGDLFRHFESEISQKLHYTGSKAALLALGGYGREEMNLFSDIDLLFLGDKSKGSYIESVTEKTLYVLWDLGLDIGHATRTISECKKAMGDDLTIMTSFLDARFLAGNEIFFYDFVKETGKVFRHSSVQKKFIKQKINESKERVMRHGGSAFVLEPDVRESQGGLRDLHLIMWIAKILGLANSLEDLKEKNVVSEEEYTCLKLARDFIWRVRNEIHLLARKKNDSLTFERQEKVALAMGYEESGGILAVEKFMQDYYKIAGQVAEMKDRLVRRMTLKSEGYGFMNRLRSRPLDSSFKVLGDQILARSRSIFDKDPLNFLRVFRWVQVTGFSLHENTKEIILSSMAGANEELRKNPEAITLFRTMLNDYKNLGQTLLAMHEVHFLEIWLPEFKKLVCRVQHDVYHYYTIDTHSIFAVNELSKLHHGEYVGQFDVYLKALKEVQKPELLTLGLFLHDIGKGEGGNHSVKGAVIANGLTARLGYSEEEQKAIEFLVLSHLMMPHLSQRRDLEDQELINQCARSIGTMDRLNMLFLLTWGDIRAVGPKAWTDWKGQLLEKLYLKTREVIEKGEYSKEKTMERVFRVRETLNKHLGERYEKDKVQKFLASMPPRYFFASDDIDIERDFVFVDKYNNDTVLMDSSTHQNLTQVRLYAINAPKVLATVAGVFSAFNINIVTVDVFQTTRGYVLIRLLVTFSTNLVVDRKTDTIKESLERVLMGQMKMQDLIDRKRLPDYLEKKAVQKAQSKVSIDNDVSAYYTVIDVYAHDRLGLLYDILRTINDLGCYVDISKISTKVEQVTDVFYVKDIFGKKIQAADKIKAIKEALVKVIS